MSQEKLRPKVEHRALDRRPSGDRIRKRLELERQMEESYGPVIGIFTPGEDLSKSRSKVNAPPEEVMAAWSGVPLPIRKIKPPVQPELVAVYSIDAYWALEASDVTQAILDYWLNQLGMKIDSLHFFDISEGSLKMEEGQEQIIVEYE